MPKTITRAAGRAAGFFRPSQRRIAVKAIADVSFARGRAVGRAEGYEQGRREAAAA